MSTTRDELEIEQIRATIGKLIAESTKLNAEAAKMTAEKTWYPFVAGAGLVAAMFAVVKLFM